MGSLFSVALSVIPLSQDTFLLGSTLLYVARTFLGAKRATIRWLAHAKVMDGSWIHHNLILMTA